MKAVQIPRFGGPEVLQVAETAAFPLGAEEVRIEVHAAGVNRADILLRTGAYHGTAVPAFPGREGSGLITEVGAAVRDFKRGDRVVAFTGKPGFYAEEVVAPARRAVKIPDGVTWSAAAALPTAWFTPWYALTQLARVRPGETVLIHAAASALGHAAVQLGRHLGARVIATAGSDEKVAWARKLGADSGINYATQDVVSEVKRLTADKGAEVVLDSVGGKAFPWSLKSLGYAGRCVAFANVTLEDSVINTRDFYPKNASIFGLQIGFLIERGYDARPDLVELLRLVADKKVQVHVAKEFSLEEAGEAHRFLERRQNFGHAVIRPRPD